MSRSISLVSTGLAEVYFAAVLQMDNVDGSDHYSKTSEGLASYSIPEAFCKSNSPLSRTPANPPDDCARYQPERVGPALGLSPARQRHCKSPRFHQCPFSIQSGQPSSHYCQPHRARGAFISVPNPNSAAPLHERHSSPREGRC